MKLTVLLDNYTYIDCYLLGEPGVCYYIEDGETKILLDVGYSGVFAENAHRLSIDLKDVNVVALSHGHNDHTGGLTRFFEDGDRRRVNLVAHPRAFDRKFHEGEEIGSPMSRQEVAQKCRLVQTKTPIALSANVTFLGEIPRIMSFEEPYSIGERETGGQREPDFMEDDTALVYRGENGIYIITGCSHSGICNIIEYAKQVTGEERVLGIIGGLHLFNDHSPQTTGTVEYLLRHKIEMIYPCHCTSFAVRAAMYAKTPIREVGVGLVLEWT